MKRNSEPMASKWKKTITGVKNCKRKLTSYDYVHVNK